MACSSRRRRQVPNGDRNQANDATTSILSIATADQTPPKVHAEDRDFLGSLVAWWCPLSVLGPCPARSALRWYNKVGTPLYQFRVYRPNLGLVARSQKNSFTTKT